MIFGTRRFLRSPADLAALTFVLVITLWQALRASSYFTLCYVDCGEVFISELQVRNFDLFGIRFGLLENHASSPSLRDHPFLYTHNVNLGSLVALLLRGLGVSTFEGRQMAVLGVFALGLWVAYSAVRRLTQSRLTALCCLILLGSTTGVFNYALHGLRAWHITGVFGSVWIVALFFEAGPVLTWRIVAAVTAVAVVAFGIGYEFWVMHLLMIGASWLLTWAVFASHERASQGARLWTIGLLILAINAAVFGVRQLHVLATLGIEFWRTDFFYSFVIKIPGMSYLLQLPPQAEIESFYSSFHILRPPASAVTAANLPHMFDLLGTHFEFSVLPKLGLMTLLLVAGFFILAALKSAKTLIHRAKSTAVAGSSPSVFSRYAVAVTGLVAGSVLGGLAFLQMWIDQYVAHFHPLLIFPCILVTGYVVALLLHLAVTAKTGRKIGVSAMVITMACVVLLSHAVLQLENQRNSYSIEVSWIGELRQRASTSFAISYLGAAAAFATHGSVLEIMPAFVNASLPRLARQQAPFTADMVALFSERDARRDPKPYLHPDFWLYFPSDRRTDSWARRPVCRFDWLTRNVLPLWQPVKLSLVPQNQLISAQRGTVVALSGRVVDNRREIEEFELLLDGEAVGESLYNCVFGTFVARIPLSQTIAPGPHVISIVARLKHGGVVNAGTADVAVSEPQTTGAPNAEQPGFIDMLAVSMPQPGVGEIRRRYPDLPIAAIRNSMSREDGFIVFDLRGVQRSH